MSFRIIDGIKGSSWLRVICDGRLFWVYSTPPATFTYDFGPLVGDAEFSVTYIQLFEKLKRPINLSAMGGP